MVLVYQELSYKTKDLLALRGSQSDLEELEETTGCIFKLMVVHGVAFEFAERSLGLVAAGSIDGRGQQQQRHGDERPR